MNDRLYNFMVSRAAKARGQPWETKPVVEGRTYCITCGGGRDKSGEDFIVAVGFGSACVTAGDALIIDEQEWIDTNEFDGAEVSLALVERVAKTRPELEWLISMHGPLSGQTYQRQGDDNWALIHRDDGFA